MFIKEVRATKQELVVFLHGVGSSHVMWDNHLASLTDYHCLAVDFPGHGQSNHLAWTNLDEVSEHIAALIKKHPHQTAHVVGLSLGGAVVIKLLSKYPQLLDTAIIDGAGVIPIAGKEFMKFGVTLVSPLLKYDVINSQIAKTLGVADEAGLRSFQQDMRAVTPYAFRTAFAQANDQTQPDQLDLVTSRTLLVAGEHEPLAVHQSNQLLAKTIPNAVAKTMPGAGHGWLAQHPQLHLEMVKAWIRKKELTAILV